MIEINGTYYAKDCIKAICSVKEDTENPKLIGLFYFEVKIALGNWVFSEMVNRYSEHLAEQSRKQLIEQLNK